VIRGLRIRGKLLVLVMTATVSALALAAVLLTAVEAWRLERDLLQDQAALARIVAENVTAALAFQDPDTARDVLRSLRFGGNQIAACVYDEAGALFAAWGSSCPPAAGPAGAAVGDETAELVAPVHVEGSTLGSVLLRSGLTEIRQRLRLQVALLVGAMALAGLVALVIALRLQRFISAPLVELAQTAAAVARDEDTSLRARRRADDELGELVDSFNLMLGRIEERDQALQQAKEVLEARVEERTRELETELAERRRAEAELAERNQQLAASNQELDDFAYIASHDLKEPLRGIHNYSGFLLEDYGDRLDDAGRQRLETLMRLTRRMERLIDTLLHYSRVGRVDLALTEVDLGELVAEQVDSLSGTLTGDDAEVEVEGILPVVRCDRTRIGEAFRNLIVNAFKYNEGPAKRVVIGALPPGSVVGDVVADPAEGPVLWVRDNGIGIAEKHQAVVFDIFKRLHPRDAYGGGTGAGLTIVQKVVERHGGRIWLQSEPGSGTTFYFTLAGRGGTTDA
jgi:signal transduction histidine kinase